MIKSLFICYTPLHAIIAKRIIDEENIRNYSLLFFCGVDNRKHQYYYKMVSNDSVYSTYSVITKSPIKDFVFLANFIRNIRNIGFSEDIVVFTGNIKIIYSRLIIHALRAKNYITYDDGSGNISGSGYFYSDDNIIKKLAFKIFSPYLQYNEIRDNQHKHYTIFKAPNVYNNVYYIQLLEPFAPPPKGNKKLNILLTSPFSEDGEMDSEMEIKIYGEIVRKYGIDQIFPHPREKKKKIDIDQVKYVETVLVAEDYINTLSKQYMVTVIGLYSTALLTLNNINGIKVVNINVSLKKPTSWLKEVFQNQNIHTESLPFIMSTE